MKITYGDRTRAINMISDPDSLVGNPEVQAIGAGDGAGVGDAMETDDWEKNDASEDDNKLAAEVDTLTIIEEMKNLAPAAAQEEMEERDEEEKEDIHNGSFR
jgi:hypothetical protein